MLSGLFGGSSSASESEPWDDASQGVRQDLGRVNGQPDWEMYGGDEVADFNGDQLSAMQGTRDFYSGQGQRGIDQMFQMGGQQAGFGNQAAAHYGQAMNQGPVQNNGIDMGQAAQYADNPYMNQMVDSASRDVTRNLYENQMPGIAAGAAGSGNLGSSRRGMQEGMAMRGAADRIGDIGANMRGQAWGQGMGYAADQANQNANFDFANRGMGMQAAQGMQSMGQQGVNSMMNAYTLQNLNNAGMMNVGNMQQGQAQNQMNNASGNFYQNQQMPYNQAMMGQGVNLPYAQSFGQQQGSSGGVGAGQGLLGMGMSLAGSYLGGMG